METVHSDFRVELCTLILVIFAANLPLLRAADIHLISKTKIATGWHPWYEIKGDPEDPQNLLLCGTKWDPRTNAPFGFVYVSSDQGRSWANVVEDRNTAWVTEHSCAFGTEHRAYFISEASKVIDGAAHHELGTTRLYVSRDAGHTWKESLRTGWADWSTSAVSVTSGRVFTFFNAYTGADAARNRGSNVGLLTFSPDGSTVSGPFFIPSIAKRNYQGAYPSDAVALRTGTIVALWFGTRLSGSGIQADLNIVRASAAQPPTLENVAILRSKDANDCVTFNQASLAYDPRPGRLFVVYIAGCKEKRVLLVSSDDEGGTWSQSSVIAEAKGSFAGFSHPSLVADGDRLAVLWEAGDGSGDWFLSTLQDRTLVSSTQLSSGEDVQSVRSNSLLTSIQNSSSFSQASDHDSIRVSVRNEGEAVWRASALLRTHDGIIAVWPCDVGNGAELWVATASRATAIQKADPNNVPPIRDVTEDSILLYGGTQVFDARNSELTACLTLKNAGPHSLTAPIELRAESISSGTGPIAATNASNGVPGAGAVWNISSSITGDRIPPHATSNPFCLTFHLSPDLAGHHSAEPKNLLDMVLRVFASGDEATARETSGRTGRN
ncbi:MAG TPA: hypothetical protein VFA89_20685 [Terriglobales bacterium]|nr:hypothetical protein [Terriglobales bacterium]